MIEVYFPKDLEGFVGLDLGDLYLNALRLFFLNLNYIQSQSAVLVSGFNGFCIDVSRKAQTTAECAEPALANVEAIRLATNLPHRLQGSAGVARRRDCTVRRASPIH